MIRSNQKHTPVLVIVLFLASIALAAAVTGFKLPAASASAATPPAAGTHPAVPASTVSPTASATSTPGSSSAGQYDPITWKGLVTFLEKDHTNWNQYIPGKYTCVEFSTDLALNAQKQGIQAWIVAVDFTGGGPGHAFVAFPTSDRGVVYVEPQADDTYPIVQVGQPLCDAWGVYQCMGKVASIQYMQCDKAEICTQYTP